MSKEKDVGRRKCSMLRWRVGESTVCPRVDIDFSDIVSTCLGVSHICPFCAVQVPSLKAAKKPFVDKRVELVHKKNWHTIMLY